MRAPCTKSRIAGYRVRLSPPRFELRSPAKRRGHCADHDELGAAANEVDDECAVGRRRRSAGPYREMIEIERVALDACTGQDAPAPQADVYPSCAPFARFTVSLPASSALASMFPEW